MPFNQEVTLNKNRYRLYREHKYLFFVFNEILQLASSLDLSTKGATTKLKDELKKLHILLQSHAEYEESRIHLILQNNNSPLFHEAEQQHQDQKHDLAMIDQKINLLEGTSKIDEIHFLSYEIYLDLRNFFCKNLQHFDYEERVIMPELQRLLTDDEIREIDRISYRQMLPEHMVDMMEVLFPHMNSDDRFVFLNEIKSCEPKKFELAWDGIGSIIDENEKNNLRESLNILDSDTKYA